MSDGLFIHRETDVITVEQLGNEFLRPERIRIQLDKSVKAFPLDLGCLAYAQRRKNSNSRIDRCTPVVTSSLVENRRDLLRCISAWFVIRGRDSSILIDYRYFEMALSWCDSNDHTNAFESTTSVAVAYQAYINFLNHRLAISEIVPLSASNQQRGFVKLIELRFPDESQHIIRSAVSIKRNRGDKRPPREADVYIYLKTCLELARRLSRFVMDEEKYPCVVALENFEVVIFPSNGGVLTPLAKRDMWIYNSPERRISTVDEYLFLTAKGGCKPRKSDALSSIKSAQDNLDGANDNPRSIYRLQLASLASQAYANIFLIITGASPTEFAQFEYEEGLKIAKSFVKKELSAVKFRAKGKVTRYAVGKRNGLELLREYLLLRAWILGDESFDKLFFSMQKIGVYTGAYTELPIDFSRSFHDRISGVYLDPKFPNISSRSIRKFKSVVLHGLGLSSTTVAEVMNHTVSTNTRDYTHTTIERQEAEFGGYWQSIRKAAEIVRDRASNNSLSTASGHCDAFNDPTPAGGLIPIQPDCKTQFGCLYCSHYICHSDEQDVHKILSLQYVINAVRDSSPDLHHAEALFRDLSVRIEFVLDAIGNSSAEGADIVKRIKRKVHDLGVLTPFWEKRLQRYEKLGVTF